MLPRRDSILDLSHDHIHDIKNTVPDWTLSLACASLVVLDWVSFSICAKMLERDMVVGKRFGAREGGMSFLNCSFYYSIWHPGGYLGRTRLGMPPYAFTKRLVKQAISAQRKKMIPSYICICSFICHICL